MLEIGIEQNKSLEMWKQYFPYSKIYGIDINKGFEHSKGCVFKGDQSNIKFLQKVVNKIKNVDFIIDDGSHKPEHQLISFCYLFENLLRPGGIYIIEDIETNYWKFGFVYGNMIRKGYKHPKSVIEIFKNLIDRINEEFIYDKSCFEKIPVPEDVQKKIGMITFCQNVIIILKKDESFTPFENRKYRYRLNLFPFWMQVFYRFFQKNV